MTPERKEQIRKRIREGSTGNPVHIQVELLLEILEAIGSLNKPAKEIIGVLEKKGKIKKIKDTLK